MKVDESWKCQEGQRERQKSNADLMDLELFSKSKQD
jgi:hypothetical protein